MLTICLSNDLKKTRLVWSLGPLTTNEGNASSFKGVHAGETSIDYPQIEPIAGLQLGITGLEHSPVGVENDIKFGIFRVSSSYFFLFF